MPGFEINAPLKYFLNHITLIPGPYFEVPLPPP
jgi:hypothetical protein